MSSSLSTTLKNAPFSPIFTGGLLYALTRAPDSVRGPLISRLRQYLSPESIARIVTGLKWLLALGLVRNVNSAISAWAVNNFRFRSERRNYDWPRELAVVTGGSGGFGSLFAKDLAKHGIKVVVLDVTEGLPADMEKNPRISYYKCDLTSRETVMEVAQQIRNDHGDPSILINNAGVAFSHDTLAVSERSLDLLFRVNIISQYYTLQAFLPAMIEKKKGHIVSIASMASYLSPPGLGPYCQTKAGVLSLWETLNNELRSYYKAPEILNSIVHPTFAATAMTADSREELKKAGAEVIDPQTVSDAVVSQIMSARSGQIVLNGSVGPWLASIKGWPLWASQLLYRAILAPPELGVVGKERTGA